MQVSLETTSTLGRKMRVSVPADQLESQIDEKIKETARQVRLKGFRPGKVPLREVRRRFGEGIRQEVSSELIQSSFSEALTQEDVSPAGMPQIEDVTLEAGEDLAYTAVFEVFPDVEPGDFSTISVERPVAEVTDADLDEMVEKLREQRKEYKEADRPAEADDQVNLDFEGFLDDEPFEGNQAEGANIVLGSGGMIPGFEDALIGVSKGDETEISVTFPEGYHAEALAGKPAVFKIKVNSVSAPELPELDEALFEQFGVTEGGVEAFHNEVRQNMERELDNAISGRVRTQVMDGLLGVTDIEVPRALIDGDIDRLRHDAIHQFGGHDKVDPSMLPSEMFETQASRRVTLGLVINAIVEKKDVQVDEDRVREHIEKMAAAYDEPEQVINFYYSNEEQMSQIKNMVLEEQVVDLIMESAQVTDVNMSYEDAVKPPEQPVPEAPLDEDAVEAVEDEPETDENTPQA